MLRRTNVVLLVFVVLCGTLSGCISNESMQNETTEEMGAVVTTESKTTEGAIGTMPEITEDNETEDIPSNLTEEDNREESIPIAGDVIDEDSSKTDTTEETTAPTENNGAGNGGDDWNLPDV